MTTLNPDHLFQQAEALFARPRAGRPRQVDLRRAISSAYYGLFHYVLIKASDEFVGAAHRNTSRYGLVYRSIDHRSLRQLCAEVRKQTASGKYRPYHPPNGFGAELRTFADATIELQEKRHSADYGPLLRFQASDALSAVGTARTAIRRFERACDERRKAFLALLVWPPR